MADEKSSVENKPVTEKPKVEGKPESSDIKPEAFKKFLKQLMRVSKRRKKRAKARTALSKHIQKLKEKPIAKLSDKKRFRKGIEGLNDKISAVLDAEQQLLGIEKQDIDLVKDLKDEIIDLKKELSETKTERNKQIIENKRVIEGLNEALESLKGRLGGYIEKKTERDKKIKQLEEKIKATPVKKHELIATRKQLEQLERKYNQLSKGAYKKEILIKIKERIDSLKQRLAEA
jgi:chromosome segregation ATPase